jgi:hypothetical protein
VDVQRHVEVEEFAPTDQFYLQLQHMYDCLEHAVYASLATGRAAAVTRGSGMPGA